MSTLENYVSKFNELTVRSVTSILELGALILDAKTDLGIDYDQFLKSIKYENKSSSIRKWECIGHARLKLMAYKDHLPTAWSTIYKLSALEVWQLDALLESGVLNPSVTAKEIDAELKGKPTTIVQPSTAIEEDLRSDLESAPDYDPSPSTPSERIEEIDYELDEATAVTEPFIIRININSGIQPNEVQMLVEYINSYRFNQIFTLTMNQVLSDALRTLKTNQLTLKIAA